MAEFILLIFCEFMILWVVYKYYEPKIEVVALVKHYRVYLWYNRWDGSVPKRVHKYLFEI